MGVVLAGIDEAGYGPLLGPLTVAMSVFRVRDWEPGQPAPDLWQLLAGAVCSRPGDKRSRIPIGDSKRLKLPNDSSRHPLTHLERAVLALLGLGSDASDARLLEAMGAAYPPHRWYAGEPAALPLANPTAQIALDAGILRSALASAGVEFLALRCVVLGEDSFNQIVRDTGTKGEATMRAIGRHLQWLRGHLTVAQVEDPVRVLCDRLGGRTTYADFLSRVFDGVAVRATEESPRVSRYEMGENWAALFQPECEAAHLPVALASMAAKLVRELAMARFNRYWSARAAALKPTAGYRGDAARWLRDTGGIVSAEERREMIRLA